MKRAAILAALLAGVGLAQAGEDDYRVKVVLVNHQEQRIEARFVIVPEDLRLVCHGEPKKVFAGDFVKVQFSPGKVLVAGMECTSIVWVHK